MVGRDPPYSRPIRQRAAASESVARPLDNAAVNCEVGLDPPPPSGHALSEGGCHQFPGVGGLRGVEDVLDRAGLEHHAEVILVEGVDGVHVGGVDGDEQVVHGADVADDRDAVELDLGDAAKLLMQHAPRMQGQIRELRDRFKLDAFMLEDDTFIAHHDWALEFARSLTASGLEFKWGCNVRADLVVKGPHLMEEMARAGLVQVNILVGTDSTVWAATIQRATRSRWVRSATSSNPSSR